jgi:transcriptional regulator with XRE-family HTH domain
MGTKKPEKAQITTKTDESTAAFDMTTEEAVAKKEIHIVGQRVKYFREKRGMEQMALAEMLGVKSNAISNWEHGRTRPDLNQIPKICAALGIGFYDLFGVDDPMRTFTAKERAIIDDYRYLNDQNKSVFNAVLTTLTERQRAEECPPITKLIKFQKQLAAGFDVSAEFDDEGEDIYLYSSEEVDSADCVFTVSGDSMEPEYHDGDLVLVRRYPGCGKLRPGDVGAFMIGNETYIKEYQKDGLHSYNEAYKTMHFNSDDHVILIGKVMGLVEEEDLATAEHIELYRVLHPDDEED